MNTTTVNIVCFAGLRKYFGSGTSVTLEADSSYSKVIDQLILANPQAKEVLSSCRIAVNEEFVRPDQKIMADTLFLIPPSSGG